MLALLAVPALSLLPKCISWWSSKLISWCPRIAIFITKERICSWRKPLNGKWKIKTNNGKWKIKTNLHYTCVAEHSILWRCTCSKDYFTLRCQCLPRIIRLPLKMISRYHNHVSFWCLSCECSWLLAWDNTVIESFCVVT